MNSLASDGIDIHTELFQGNIKVAIAQVVGDNLGFYFPCRTCKMHRNGVQTKCFEDRDLLRTLENYEDDLQLQNLQETGIKLPCPLNDVVHFHIINNRAPDIMHDMLEGVCPLELKLVLNKLIKKRYFTLKMLNSRMTSFNYGIPDNSNKPCPFSDASLRSPDGAAGQNAG